MPYPISANTTPSRSVKGCSDGATSMKRVQFSAAMPSPRCPWPAANNKTVPSNAKPRPRLPSTRNFQPASSDVSLSWKVMRKTDASVVSSTAIHMMPRLFDIETRSIANT